MIEIIRISSNEKMFRSSILLLIIIGASLVNSQDKLNYLRCNPSTHCLCMEHGEVEIQCPQFEPQVFVRITPNNQVHFECENITNREYELIPNYNLDVASFLTVTKCPLMPGTPILNSYLRNIKMNKIRTIQFLSSGVNRGANIESKHFDGFENVTRFDLRGNEEEFDNLPSDLFENLTNISWLRIRVPKIHFPSDLLLPLKNVEFLELGHNKIESIPAGFFKNQQKLRHLIFWGNNLRNLNKDTFVGLSSVEDLDLSANGLESLDADLLKPLTNLTEINLSSNNLISLPKGLLTNNTQLKTFKLLENRIIMLTLPEGLFADLDQLQTVYIKCGLQTLPEDLFRGAENIIDVSLEANSIFSLPDKLFSGLNRMEKLDLSNNLISQITEETFKDLTSLDELNLSRNRLKIIPSKSFLSMRSLQNLYLSDNKIETIEYLGLNGLQNVKSITLRNNSLDFSIDNVQRSSPFQELKNLETLDLSYNKIQSIIEDFTLENLRYLHLEHNNITQFDVNDLQAYFNREDLTVDLSHNLIESIDFNGPHSEPNAPINVNLNYNPIECDCRIWEFAKYLRDPNNKIKIIHENLRCESPQNLMDNSIYSVDLMKLVCPLDNELTGKKHCPNECSCLSRPEDKTLLMTCNETLNSFPSYQDMKLAKTELKIEGRNLTHLPTTTRSSGYQNVTRLHVNGNNIREIRKENLPPRLEFFDISYNNIESMNKTVTDLIGKLPLEKYSLNLTGNPIRCDCKNQEFLNFIKKMNDEKKIAKYHDLLCSNGQNLDIIDPSSLCTENNLLVMVLCIIVAVMGLLIGGLAALYYKYQKQIKMWLYANNLCLWFVSEEELDKDKKYDAFVSYSHRDQNFIANYLVPELEQGPIKYKLCVHERDWAPGVEISTQISNSVNDSKRTIIIMSPNYLQSNWAQWEFRVAQSHAATEKRSRIIIILYGDIGDINKLEPDIRDYLKLNTYVKWGDKWFWEKLKYAMPHVKLSERSEKSTKGLVKSPITSSVDDKLELIKPISVTPPQLTTPPAEKVGNPLISSLNARNNAKNQSNRIMNGFNGNGHVNGAFVINTSSRQSDV